MPTSEELRAGPYFKLERAKHHINDLNGKIDAYLADRPIKLIIQFKRKIGRVVLRTKTEKPIPPELSLIIGDAVHNLRSALDLTLFGMAHDKTPKPHLIQFPFPRKEDGLEGAINQGQVKFAGEKVAEAVRRINPTPKGNPNLSGLHALDTRDKHRLLIFSRHVANIPVEDVSKMLQKFMSIRFVGEDAVFRWTGPEDGEIFTVGTKFVTRDLPDSERETELQPAFGICFGKSIPFEDCLIIQTLHSLTKDVASAVDCLIDAYIYNNKNITPSPVT